MQDNFNIYHKPYISGYVEEDNFWKIFATCKLPIYGLSKSKKEPPPATNKIGEYVFVKNIPVQTSYSTCKVISQDSVKYHEFTPEKDNKRFRKVSENICEIHIFRDEYGGKNVELEEIL